MSSVDVSNYVLCRQNIRPYMTVDVLNELGVLPWNGMEDFHHKTTEIFIRRYPFPFKLFSKEIMKMICDLIYEYANDVSAFQHSVGKSMGTWITDIRRINADQSNKGRAFTQEDFEAFMEDQLQKAPEASDRASVSSLSQEHQDFLREQQSETQRQLSEKMVERKQSEDIIGSSEEQVNQPLCPRQQKQLFDMLSHVVLTQFPKYTSRNKEQIQKINDIVLHLLENDLPYTAIELYDCIGKAAGISSMSVMRQVLACLSQTHILECATIPENGKRYLPYRYKLNSGIRRQYSTEAEVNIH